MRFYVPLAPVVILAAVASVNACGKERAGEADRLRVIPPPAALARAEVSARTPPRPAPAPEPVVAEAAPSPEEVRAFERPVAK